ncbi:MAG: hypothetical protein GY856_41265 [bacterium]|nr:hypothetical protein [bacterium]
MSIDAFGSSAEVEVRDLPRAEAETAVRAALTEIHAISQLVDPAGEQPGGVGALNHAAGRGPQPVDARLAELVLRSLQFCIWSGGAYGPLGGELNRLWAEREDRRRPPPLDALRLAVGNADCSRVNLRRGASPTIELTAGSGIDTLGIARGFAIDRVVEGLEQQGVENAWVEIGNVWRAMGDGASGNGWLVTLPPVPGAQDKEPMDQLWLRDQALTILTSSADEEPTVPVLDQRTGVPASGVVTVVTVSELAADAQPLAMTLFILGHREGHMRLGILDPRPSVFWLLGEGRGRPLEATYRWSELQRIRRR